VRLTPWDDGGTVKNRLNQDKKYFGWMLAVLQRILNSDGFTAMFKKRLGMWYSVDSCLKGKAEPDYYN
jgi:hypothetical protein